MVKNHITSRFKILIWTGATGLVVTALAVTYWIWRFQHYTPVEVVLDVRAAIAARNAPRPVERFLELRYGPLSEPANRQKAFVDFFNVGHIEGLHLIVKHAPAERRQSSITSMAQWIANYRGTMTLQEKQSLRAYFGSEVGHAALQQATAKYLAHDIHYRATTAPVIEELMATITAVQKP